MEALEPHNRYEGEVCTKEGESISTIERRERGSERLYIRTIEKKIHPTLKITSNSASVLCRIKRWQEVDGTEL